MRKFFAWIEIAASVILAVYAVAGSVQLRLNSAVVLADNLAKTTANYREVVVNGKNSMETVYQTNPLWRESPAAIQITLKSLLRRYPHIRLSSPFGAALFFPGYSV